jgi:hypothetical protein
VTNAARKELILAAVKKARASGWRIVPENYFRGDQCCPLGAVVLDRFPRRHFLEPLNIIQVSDLLAEPLELGSSACERWVEEFADGFDGFGGLGEAWRMGRDLRRELLKDEENL